MEYDALKAAYNDNLRLSAPVEYWSKLEAEYRKNGRINATVAAAIVVIAAVCGIWVLYNPPEIWWSVNAGPIIKSAAITVAVISIVLYLLIFFIRLSTSCYHLSRDARERRQLTHIYLALIKDQAAPEDARQTIIAALFARADTGLLKNDGAPAFPTSLGAILDALKK